MDNETLLLIKNFFSEVGLNVEDLSSLDGIVKNNKSFYGNKNLNQIINNPSLINRLRNFIKLSPNVRHCDW